MKTKKKIRIIISIIIAVCVAVCAIFILSNIDAQADTLTLSQAQINNDTNLLNEFISSINTNNENTYMSLTTSSMKEESVLKTLISYFEPYGKLESLTYEDSLKSGIYNNIVFNASFTNKDNVTLVLSLNNDNKIVGIHM